MSATTGSIRIADKISHISRQSLNIVGGSYIIAVMVEFRMVTTRAWRRTPSLS